MVWGSVSGSGVGRLAEIPTTMDAKLYVNILDNNLIQSATDLGIQDNFIFQSDNDPKHTSRLAKTWLMVHLIECLVWPPQSPDLNIIENLWDYLDSHIPKSSRKSYNLFKTAIFETWRNIPQELINNLIKSIPNRLQEVIAANGENTSY